jgi:tRNA A37 threonylcarbamoyladenosine dehydratase
MSKEIKSWMGRSQLLMGEEKLHKLINKNVLVVGLGGVGGIAAEMIARSGVGKMTIVDADTVEETNRNRQMPALLSTDGQLKSEVMATRIRDINPDIELTVISKFFKDETTTEILDSQQFDYAYAITTHKAQGSQWPYVLIQDESWCFRDDRWKWLYTAITRASEKITLVRN